MKCCKPNHFLFNPLSVPPDFNPPTVGSELYLYAMVIQGDLYDPANDTYNYLVVGGNIYNTSGGSLLSQDFGGDTNTALGVDYAQALPDQTGNGYKYIGYKMDEFTNAYFFMFVTSEAQNIAVNVTLSGVTSLIGLTGGLVSYSNRCLDITTATPTLDGIGSLTVTVNDETGSPAAYTIYDNSGVDLTDAAKWLGQLNLYFNSDPGYLLSTNINYTDNGDGTVTLSYTYPSSTVILKSAFVNPNTINFNNC